MIDLTDTVTVSQAAATAAVDQETIRRWIRYRLLDATQVPNEPGGQWFIRSSDLDAYLAARRKEG